MIAVKINSSKFSRDFGSLLSRAKNPGVMLSSAGRVLASDLKQWFRGKEKTDANHLSERRSHFWLAVANSVSQPRREGANSVSVSITHPAFAQKHFGGPIVAKRSKALTIPVEERAYGRTASTFEHETGLKLFLLKTGKSAFSNAVLAVQEKGGLTVEYILKKTVTQQSDATALPPEGQLERAILANAQRTLMRQIGGGA